MSHKVNLVRVFTTATGNSTPITLGAAYSQLFMTPAEAGAMDGRVYTYLIVDGNDWEMGRGAYTASGTSLARTTILASRIAGNLGTSRITLTGTAQVRFIEAAEDMDGVRGTRVVTGTSDVLANSDQGFVVTYSNASAIAVSLAQAGSSNLFLNGWATNVQNLGAGTVTITPATSTINGAATLTLATGMGAVIWSDGTNYRAYFVSGSKPALAANNLSDVNATAARTNLDLVKQTSNVDSIANRVLLTGAFGLGKAIPLANDNCLAIRVSGWYFMFGTTANLPPGATQGYLFVNYYDDNNIVYRFQQYDSSNEWICIRYGGAYGVWINIGTAMAADRAFRRGNILGTVAQSGGVPTGALIEYAANANGWYVRFADGLQICGMPGKTFTDITTVAGGLYQGTQVTISLPAAFVTAQYAIYGSTDSTNIWAVINPATVSSCYVQLFCIGSVSGTRYYHAIAIGRWF